MIYRIGYMVDPGDGIVSYEDYHHAEFPEDDMISALCNWQNERSEQGLDPYFIVSCVCQPEEDL